MKLFTLNNSSYDLHPIILMQNSLLLRSLFIRDIFFFDLYLISNNIPGSSFNGLILFSSYKRFQFL